jgi:enamine deaminase RidA (YjgF/YER057c/UK114 family)
MSGARLKTVDLDVPLGPLSAAVISSGPVVHVSGQSSLDNGKPVTSTVEQETHLALVNLERVLHRAGTDRTGVYAAVSTSSIWRTMTK